ncbi:MAG TPA: heme biosynthesis HemY N-terminal domain-containing protein [Rubrivivax sp.]|nr:heme biosynthesis HemY N-terminal domain-containing protein [Rubrivivax sp.]HPO19936.1 heme biosynthesis HemY N-terminal domain-containing protein [Rubrivivax sp.]
MRGIVWLVLLFVAAVVAATTLGRNDGLVSIYFGQWRTDLSLNLFVILVLAACAVLIAAARSIGSLVSLPRRAHAWRELKRERAAQAALREALAELLAARYSRAHRAAQRALVIQADTEALRADLDFAALAHLLGAASLHSMQDRSRRDELMRQLGQLPRKAAAPGAVDEGARLLAAEWAIDDRDAARAIELLAELPAGVSRRTQALRLRLLAQRLSQQPLPALQTARLLAKHQAFTPGVAPSLLRTLAGEALDETLDADALRRVWSQLDPADRRDASLAARAAARAARFGVHEDARDWLRPFWDRLHELDADERQRVALAFVDAVPGMPSEWLPRLEGAMQLLPGDPAVAVAAGTAMVERQLWGKARRPLEQAAESAGLVGSARRHAWRSLAQLAQREGDEQRAQRCTHAAAAID